MLNLLLNKRGEKVKKIIDIYLKYEEIINYFIIGVLTTLISLIVYYICVFTFLNPEKAFELQFANILSWTIGVIFAYITNRKFVFKSKNKNILQECGKFAISRIMTLIIDMLFMHITVTRLSLNDKIMKIISNVIIIILNYILSKLIVFNKKQMEVL